jgi:glutamate-1-semialdehyde 2,1-aminomutase
MDEKESNEIWHRRATALTPAGVHSNARLVGADVVFTHGDGPWLFDVEGHRHVDYMLGRGPAFLGHTPTSVNDAVAAAATRGITLGSGTTLEVEAASVALSVIEWADQIRFVSSGTEAVQSAFRLARAATGRSLIVQFEGMYHGWIDNVSLVAGADPARALPATGGQVANSGAHTLLLPWNDIGAVEQAFAVHGHDVAAVITEPANLFGGVLAAPGYLEALRAVTSRFGSALIFDEVVCGFRLRPGSSASLFGVTPDLATFAKAMGSGWPVAAVAGTSRMFDGVAGDRVRLSGTYNGNAAAMAAIVGTLGAMRDGSSRAPRCPSPHRGFPDRVLVGVRRSRSGRQRRLGRTTRTRPPSPQRDPVPPHLAHIIGPHRRSPPLHHRTLHQSPRQPGHSPTRTERLTVSPTASGTFGLSKFRANCGVCGTSVGSRVGREESASTLV